MESEVVSSGVELGLTIYEMLAGVITAGVTWLGVKLSSLIKSKVKNQLVGGMLARLNDSAFEAVKAVNEQMKVLITKSKDPASPGGVKITQDEASILKKAALDHVRFRSSPSDLPWWCHPKYPEAPYVYRPPLALTCPGSRRPSTPSAS